MSEKDYNKLIVGDGEAVIMNPGKNKMLLQALDVSGSMCGRPMEALKEACQQLGQRYFGSDNRAFEKFITLTHNHDIDEEFQSESLETYKTRVS